MTGFLFQFARFDVDSGNLYRLAITYWDLEPGIFVGWRVEVVQELNVYLPSAPTTHFATFSPGLISRPFG